MVIETDSDKKPTDGSPAPSHAREVTGGAVMPSGYRETCRNVRNEVVNDVLACAEEGSLLGQILQGFAVASGLPETFRFEDAIAYEPPRTTDTSSLGVELLISKMSEKVKEMAGRADELCDNPEAKAVYMHRLERQFNERLRELVEDERKECERKIGGLCSRMHSVASQLASEYRGRFDDDVAHLRGMATSLLRYSSLYLSSPKKSQSSITLVSANPNGPSLAIPLEDFFERLKSVTLGLAHALYEQNAA